MKKRGISNHAIVQQLFVSGSRRPLAKLRVVEIEMYGVGGKRRAGYFSSHLKRDPFFRLNIKDQPVWGDHLVLVGPKQRQRRGLEPNHNLRHSFSQPFPRSQIERHTRPTPIVDHQFNRRVSLNIRFRIDVFLLTVTWYRRTADLTRPVLSSDGGR